MQIVLAQTKYKTGDFEYNYKQISEQVTTKQFDLIVFPDIEDLGEKDLNYDEKYLADLNNFYEQIAKNYPDKNVLIGQILIKNGEIELTEDGFYEIDGECIYVDDIYRDDVVCDLYILAKNKYFVKDTYKDFVDSINTRNNFIYINSVAMCDCNIYAGGSFAKNKDNELVLHFPICETVATEIDLTKTIKFKEAIEEELIYKVLTFALKEYCENSGFKKVILGLSGGVDSAIVAALAAHSIGKENVLGVMMPSMYSSEGSITDSEKLAHNLGIEITTEPITPFFKKFMENKENLGDLAEENLQARIRGLILMFISNRDNRLLLCTSNKSEAAMGFGTLYGDLAGGLNIICDLTKTNVYKLCNYINRNEEVIPNEILTKAPSAELRPNQKDQDRLPEYAILDDIIEMYLEKNTPYEIMYNKYGKELVDEIIKKIYRFQFKRKQNCLGVRITERSFCEGINLSITQRYF